MRNKPRPIELTRLVKWLHTHEPAALLSATHLTRLKQFRDIVEAGHIAVSASGRAELPAAYLFYGRPAYRNQNQEDRATADLADFPACFVFKEAVLERVSQIFPFDTGAYTSGYYKTFFSSYTLSDFLVPAKSEYLGRLVTGFFGTNTNYLADKAVPIQVDAAEFEVIALSNLFRRTGQTDFDDRCSTTELSFQSPIPVNRDTVKGVVVPAAFADSNWFLQRVVSDLGVEVKTYETFGGRPAEWQSTMRERVYSF